MSGLRSHFIRVSIHAVRTNLFRAHFHVYICDLLTFFTVWFSQLIQLCHLTPFVCFFFSLEVLLLTTLTTIDRPHKKTDMPRAFLSFSLVMTTASYRDHPSRRANSARARASRRSIDRCYTQRIVRYRNCPSHPDGISVVTEIGRAHV